MDHPLLVSIGQGYTGVVDDAPEEETATPPERRVPWYLFSYAIREMARRHGWDAPGGGRTPEAFYDSGERLLSRLNGPLPDQWCFRGIFAAFARRNEGKEAQFEEFIRQVHEMVSRQVHGPPPLDMPVVK
jgi:hypothetical protein